MKTDYVITEDEFIKLTKVDGKITCGQCGWTLILKSGSSHLIKASVVMTTEDNGFVLRCGKCKTFNVIKAGIHTLAI